MTEKARSAGRYPQKLSEELIGGIVECIRVGNYRCTAAKIAGVSTESVRRWMRRGETIYEYLAGCQEEGVPPDPLNDLDRLRVRQSGAVQVAEAEAKMKAVAALMKTMAGWEERTTETVLAPRKDGEGQRVVRRTLRTVERRDWRPASKYLETRFLDRWSPMREIEMSGAMTRTVILESVPEDLTAKGAKEWAKERTRLAEKYDEGGHS